MNNGILSIIEKIKIFITIHSADKISGKKGQTQSIILLLLLIPLVTAATYNITINQSIEANVNLMNNLSAVDLPICITSSENALPYFQNLTYNETTNYSFQNSDTATVEQSKVSEPVFSTEIRVPDRTTRGEIIEITAIVESSGSEAKNVILTWSLPEGFSTDSNVTECGNIAKDDSCSSSIKAVTSLSTHLGINSVKVLVSYD